LQLARISSTLCRAKERERERDEEKCKTRANRLYAPSALMVNHLHLRRVSVGQRFESVGGWWTSRRQRRRKSCIRRRQTSHSERSCPTDCSQSAWEKEKEPLSWADY